MKEPNIEQQAKQFADAATDLLISIDNEAKAKAVAMFLEQVKEDAEVERGRAEARVRTAEAILGMLKRPGAKLKR